MQYYTYIANSMIIFVRIKSSTYPFANYPHTTEHKHTHTDRRARVHAQQTSYHVMRSLVSHHIRDIQRASKQPTKHVRCTLMKSTARAKGENLIIS